jgi:hypothetical protein
VVEVTEDVQRFSALEIVEAKVLAAGQALGLLHQEDELDGGNEVEEREQGHEIAVDPGSVPSEPNVVLENCGHLAELDVRVEPLQAFVDALLARAALGGGVPALVLQEVVRRLRHLDHGLEAVLRIAVVVDNVTAGRICRRKGRKNDNLRILQYEFVFTHSSCCFGIATTLPWVLKIAQVRTEQDCYKLSRTKRNLPVS